MSVLVLTVLLAGPLLLALAAAHRYNEPRPPDPARPVMACSCHPGHTCGPDDRDGDCTRTEGDMRRSLRIALVVIFAVGIGALLGVQLFTPGDDDGRSTPTTGTVTAERMLMGTTWRIVATPPDGMTDEQAHDALAAAFAEVDRVEQIMSTWIPDSPISRLNASAGGDGVEVPVELRAIIERSVARGEQTRGAFDVTWKGMGNLWPLRDEAFTPPDDATIRAAMARVDYRAIRIDGDRVTLPRPGMAIGLGGIAKGYGVDRAATVLRDAGIERFYIDGGGDLLMGAPEGARPWQVGIRDPRGGPDDLLFALSVRTGAVATSGDYERYRIVDGVRYHHIIDPRTGRPAAGARQATVVAPTAEAADALATGVFVLGPADGLALVESLDGTEALIVDATGETHMSSGFGALVREDRSSPAPR